MKKIVSFICSIVLMIALISNIKIENVFALVLPNVYIESGETYEITVPDKFNLGSYLRIDMMGQVQVAFYNNFGEQIYTSYTDNIQREYNKLKNCKMWYKISKIRISSINGTVPVYLSENLPIKAVKELVFKDSIKLNYGESYEFINEGENNAVLGVERKDVETKVAIDSVASNEDISLVSIYDNVEERINCYSKGKTQITCKEKDGVTIYIPQEFEGTINKVDTPTLYYKNIEINKVYDFTNNTEKNFNIIADTEEDFEGTIYEKDKGLINTFNTSKLFKTSERWYYRIFKSGDGFKITKKEGQAFNIIVPYECKDSIVEVQDAEEVLDKITLIEGQILEINSQEEGLKLITNGQYYENNFRFNSITYEEDGESTKNHLNSYGYVTLNRKGAMEVESGGAIDVYIPHEYMKYCKISEGQLFKQIVINQGEKYEFKNSIENAEFIPSIQFKNLSYGEKGVSFYGENNKGDITFFSQDFSNSVLVKPEETVTVEVLSEDSKTLCIPYIYGDCVKKIDFYKEDINKDNVISLEDFSMVADKLGVLVEKDIEAKKCDINKDGVVDLKDVVRVARRIE